MARTKTSERDEKHELTRRALIKWSVAAGAALGVSRSKIFEILEKTGGTGLAYAASARATKRAVVIEAGNGSLAWCQLHWPFPAIAAGSTTNAQLSWHLPGKSTVVAGTAKPLTIGTDTPWASLLPQNQVTAFLCGTNETHTNVPKSTQTLNNNDIFGVVSALQSSAPATIPVVTIGGAKIGTAPGAAVASNVSNADGIVGLFNSAASRMGGLLAKSGDATLYKTQYDAFIQLNRAAGQPTQTGAYRTASGAASLLGTNLSSQLQITPADLTRYGLANNPKASLLALGKGLIVTAKAFGLGLTNMVAMPHFNDDPHGAFDNNDVATVPGALKTVFDAFMADITTLIDSDAGTPIAADTVIAFTGDTYKSPTNKAGWGDNTPSGSNIVYVYSAGALKSGWFGSVDAAGKATGFGADGNPATYDPVATAKYATASIAYAVANRDERAIANFANGTTIGGVFGNLKDK
jgi:hypothetical protein